MKPDSVIFIDRYNSPCGELILGSYGGKLCLCEWAAGCRTKAIIDRMCRELGTVYEESMSDVAAKAKRQLDEYFAGGRRTFDIPLTAAGTDFQKKVWDELMLIPYGRTVSYKEVAERIGRPSAVRAVANAVGANPVSILVPCHRVIGSGRTLTGYAGGLAAKKFLLELESVDFIE